MHKTSKADLVHQLEQNVSIIQTLPIFDISRTTLIRDDMPLLQSTNAKRFRTFGEMALDFVKNQISCFGFVHCAIVVKQLYWNRTNWKRQNLFNSNDNLQEPVPDEKLAQDSYEQ
jgi:hypothetical protein